MKTSADKRRRRRKQTPPTAIATVLATFPSDGGCITRAQLIERTGLEKTYVWRKITLLTAERLVYSHRRGCFKLTPEGEARRAAMGDAALTLGRKRFADREEPDFQDRLWTAARLERKGSVDSFIALAARDDDKAPVQSAHHYLKLLVQHGVMQRVSPPRRRPVRFAMIRDLGPRRPHLVEGRLFDPNANRFLERSPA